VHVYGFGLSALEIGCAEGEEVLAVLAGARNCEYVGCSWCKVGMVGDGWVELTGRLRRQRCSRIAILLYS
jgi:hypothetical protein